MAEIERDYRIRVSARVMFHPDAATGAEIERLRESGDTAALSRLVSAALWLTPDARPHVCGVFVAMSLDSGGIVEIPESRLGEIDSGLHRVERIEFELGEDE